MLRLKSNIKKAAHSIYSVTILNLLEDIVRLLEFKAIEDKGGMIWINPLSVHITINNG